MHFEVVAVMGFASHVIVLLSNKDNAATSTDTTEREKHTLVVGGLLCAKCRVNSSSHTVHLVFPTTVCGVKIFSFF